MSKQLDKLCINDYLYERAVGFLRNRSSRKMEELPKEIQKVAQWAWFHHPGRFADGALENLAFEVGCNIKEIGSRNSIRVPSRRKRSSRTLHLATRLLAIGGHSRVLAKWTERDRSAEHIVVLTDQREGVPYFLQRIITRNGNLCICLPTNISIERRAAIVRHISESCDRVILHTHPDDPIPVVAFAKDGGPSIAMFNHAHFSFNLGATVSDITINTLEYFRKISMKYRFARSTKVLYFLTGTEPIGLSEIDKEAAKKKLDLPKDATVIISIAQEHYFYPIKGYDFFHTLRLLLQRLREAYVILIGVRPDSSFVSSDLRSNPRLLMTGYIENPIVYYQASDICLESFPIPSLGAVAEAVAYGESYPVPVYGQGESILRPTQPQIRTVRPADEQTYIEYVESLALRKREIRDMARQMRERISLEDQLLEERLDDLNTLIDTQKHNPREIAVTKMIESDDCRNLAEVDHSDIGEKIDGLFAFAKSLYYHFVAVVDGGESFDAATQRILKRLKYAVARRIS